MPLIDFILDGAADILLNALQLLIVFLPFSPFANLVLPESLRVFVAYANYYIPVLRLIKMLEVWVIAMLTFFIVSFVIKVVRSVL